MSNIVCSICHKTFTVLSNCLRHMRKQHSVNASTSSNGVKGSACEHDDCSQSSALYFGTALYRKHLSEAHGVPDILRCTELNFTSYEGL